MQNELSDLNRHVLATFGQPVMIFREDVLLVESRGILSKELVPVGQFDSVLQTVTVVSLPAELELQRGDEVQSADQQWTVDCKLKDNGQMIWWRLHEA
ncbi:hypothetical protein [Endozoicomonas ascidiicola]|uniref:hypothetical protein n=1 Tax=Endozoicomonas ascidiicola TaxID=1698521 RepID=UPI00082AF31D|nr:hypothetical protein [Endozoicomonas ascidiicola]